MSVSNLMLTITDQKHAKSSCSWLDLRYPGSFRSVRPLSQAADAALADFARGQSLKDSAGATFLLRASVHQ